MYNTFTFGTINILLLIAIIIIIIIIIINNAIKIMIVTVTVKQAIFTEITVLTHQSETLLHKPCDVQTSRYVTFYRS
jgi:uncharacterized protein YoxC